MSGVPVTAPTTEHALLSASGAERWLTCTPSARLEQQFPDTTSEYAKEGSLAHAIAELKCRKQFVEPMSTKKFNSALKKLQKDPLYKEEMLHYTDIYVDYVSSIVHSFDSPPYVTFEKRLDLTAYVPESFGTADCVIIGNKKLHVVDFKYGQGVPVSSERNKQMMLYALGAYTEYGFLYPIETVQLSIVQPRLDNTSEFEISIGALLGWGISIQEPSQKAFNGEGEYIQGDHCKFCRAKSLCRARSEFNTSLEEYNFMKPPLISNEEVGQILEKAQNLAKWAKDLEEYALNACLNGENIPGWKAVEGRSNRAFTDLDKAFEVLKQNGIEEAMLYERKPISLTAVEKLVTKKKFNELLTEYVDKPPGKPTLAQEKDKREAITPQMKAEEAFKEPIKNKELIKNTENKGDNNYE